MKALQLSSIKNTIHLPAIAVLVALSSSPVHGADDALVANVTTEMGSNSITVVIVDDLQRKPVPLTDFRLTSTSGNTQTFRTDELGQLKFSLPVGDYILENSKPLSFEGKLLTWKVAVHVNQGDNAPQVFTDADATSVVESVVPVTSIAPLQSNVMEGTKLRLELTEPLRSNKVRKGGEVHLVLKDQLLDGNKQVLLRSGAKAVGHVTYAKGAGSFGKKGKLEFAIDNITAVDGTIVPLRSTSTANGKNNMLGGAVGIILFGPLMGFVKGKNVTVDQGTILEAYVDKTTPVALVEAAK